MSHEVHVPKLLISKIFEPFLKSCTSEVCVPRGLGVSYHTNPFKTFLICNTVRPRGTRPRGTRTSTVHDFKKGSKIFEISDFGTWTSWYTILKSAQFFCDFTRFFSKIFVILHDFSLLTRYVSNEIKAESCHDSL